MGRVWGLALTLAALASSCSTPGTGAAVAQPSKASANAASPSVTGTPTPVPRTSTPSSALPSFVGEPAGDTGVRTNALGDLHGRWIFVGKQVVRPGNARVEVQIWAVPLGGGPPKPAFAYDASLGGAPEAIIDNAPYLRRQFSPDGMKVIVSVSGQLVIVDLPTGTARRLGAAGYYPSWSKQGSQVAYLADAPVPGRATPDHVLSVVPTSGGAARELLNIGSARSSAEWSPDGSQLIVAESDAIAIVDVATAGVVQRIAPASGAGSSFAHWRTASPQVAVIATSCRPGRTTRLEVLDSGRAPERVVRDTNEACTAISMTDPRWNPAASSELLYIVARMAGGSADLAVHVVDVGTSNDVALPLNAWEATWTWDGQQIAYLAKTGIRTPYGESLRIASRDGGNDHEVLSAQDGAFFSIASLSY